MQRAGRSKGFGFGFGFTQNSEGSWKGTGGDMSELYVERQLWMQMMAEVQNTLESHGSSGRWVQGAGTSFLPLCPQAHRPPHPFSASALLLPEQD